MVIFRCDVSPRTGLRSLRRCAYLAALLKKNPGALVCSREDKKAAKFLAEGNLPLRLAKEPSALDPGAARALVFDLDDFSAADKALLQRAREAGIKTVQILSPGNAAQAADIVLSPFTEPENSLLHHKFRHFNTARKKTRKQVKNIFINLGDLLPYRDLREIVDTLHRLRCKLKIMPGASLKKADKRNLMKIYPGSHFCGRSESPARAYFEADLALIPPGDEALEAACVGTPALYLAMTKGQEALADSCAAKGLGIKAPPQADWTVQSIRDSLAALDLETREKMGAAGKALVDGLGVHRFFKVLKENGIIE
jgi:spore coat polysaccharide biosynthesis predicted glycosyltransferase SpsG